MASNKEEPIDKNKKTSNILRAKQKNNLFNNKYLIPLLGLVIAFIAIGTAVYTNQQMQQLKKQMMQSNNSLSTQVKELEHNQNQTQKQINAKSKKTENIQVDLQAQFKNLKNEVQTSMSQRFYQKQDWLLLKVRYYLELAQINAHWNNNFDLTIALLQQADQLLKQINDSKIFNIRQAIAKDIAKAQASPRIDVAGILSQIDAMQNSVNDLSIPLPAINSSESEPKPKSSSFAWGLNLKGTMNVLENLVVIRRHDQNIKPLMSPLLEALLKEKIQLNLQEAQWAVLNNNATVYQLVLKQVMDNLKSNFNERAQNTQVLIKKLSELQQIKLIQDKLTIDSALPLLNELIDAKKSPLNQTMNSEQGGN